MVDTRKLRAAAFILSLLLFVSAIGLFLLDRKRRCLGVEILSDREASWLQEYAYQDYSRYFLYNGQRAAVDSETSTIYIPQDITPETKMEDMLGNLRFSGSRQKIAFAPDEAFENLAEAVADNHSFTLYVTDGSGAYMQYNVVFTTLPVLRIDGEFFDYDEKGREVNRGDLCLWTPLDPDSGHYSAKQSNVHWHIRGGSSANQPKTPWRLSLKKGSGGNKNLSMLGMGSDDDWFLNPMSLDDTKLKEQLFIQLWNERAQQVEWNAPMSRGKYVEVVMNGRYMGLFQLQRRVDGKFLNLDAADVLLKGGGGWDAETSQEAYEIVHSSLSEPETYGLMDGFLQKEDSHMVNLDNFLDVNLFLQAATALDNLNHANMFYLLTSGETGYQLQLLPWDTDMSWGTLWRGEGFVYDFEESRQRMALRREYDWLREVHPDLDRQMAERWLQLRQNLLTMESVTAILEAEQQILDTSGAQKRDQDRWGLYYRGEDSLENLYRMVEARFAWVDDYYGQFLP